MGVLVYIYRLSDLNVQYFTVVLVEYPTEHHCVIECGVGFSHHHQVFEAHLFFPHWKISWSWRMQKNFLIEIVFSQLNLDWTTWLYIPL